MLLVCMGRAWPTAASSHRPLFASVEPGLGVLNKCKGPDEAGVGDMCSDGRGLERLVAY